MKSFIAASFVAALASVATAQFDNIPTCALTCFIDPLTNDGCSGLTDFACHCKKSDTLISSVTPCVQKSCGAEDQAKVISGVEETCAQAGVTISVPNPAGSTSAAPASSAAPSSAAASSAAATSAAATSAAESSKAAESSAAASSGYATVQTSTSAAATPSGNSTTPTASAPSQFTGAAALPTQAAGLLGAAALALLAL